TRTKAIAMAEPQKPTSKGEPGDASPPTVRPMLIWYVVTLLLLLWLWQDAFRQVAMRTIPYSEFKAGLTKGEVSDCIVEQDEITGKITPMAKEAKAGESFGFRTVRVEDPQLVADLEKAGAAFSGVRPGLLSRLLPIGMIALFWWAMSRRLGGAGESVLSFGRSRARLIAEKSTGVTFEDVAGCDEAKAELVEIVDFLRDSERYRSLGAKIPKGVLLLGPPGTGKTLLARAIAGEARVPFFSLSGSEFVEMFVGVGAARVRDLFQQAKAQAPCLVFIDELDAIGGQRGVHLGTVSDEREQTLNQLLVEMDGFEPNSGVILLAATNRPEVLDRALLRPGRFDRQVVIDAPDLDGREAILKIHARDKPLAADVDLRRIARSTPGFSGADLANAMNEAALLAARRYSEAITQRDIEDAVEKVVAGPERKSRRLVEKERTRVAYHEVGHALVATHCEHADPVRKISIIPRGRAARGYTLQLPTGDQFLLSRSDLVDRIRGLLGGRAAEELVFGEVTTGAENDLEHATALARQMVGLYGMSDSIGLAHVGLRQSPFLPAAQDGAIQRDCSEQTAREIDEEVKAILADAYESAQQILGAHRDQLERIAGELLRRETLDEQAFRALLDGPPPAELNEGSAAPPASSNGVAFNRLAVPCIAPDSRDLLT
ncbi:MAG: ATP-dependent zinc metalloprotease FtsH, partial [Isosphaeraceae bacterium]